MIARCARCQQTFTTQVFGVQRCPYCGTEIHLADPSAPVPPAAPSPPPGPPAGGAWPQPPAWGAAPPPPGTWGPTGGPPPPPPGGWGPIPPGGLPPPPPPDGESAPFAQWRRLGFFSAFAQTFKLVALEPTRFFGQVKISETGSAVLFAVVAATVASAVQAAFSALAGTATSGLMRNWAEQLPAAAPGLDPRALEWLQQLQRGASVAQLIGQVVMAPIGAVLSVYIWSGLLHVVLLIVRGAPRGFDATVTVVGYSLGLMLIAALPVCGGFIALVWFTIAAIAGLSASQRIGLGKASAAVLTPWLLVCLCLCALGAFVATVVGAAFKGAGGTSL